MYGFDGGWGMGAWIAMAVLMVVFWGGVVAVIVVFLRRSHFGRTAMGLHPSHHEAERILNERFARGEIDETEYLARRTALRRPD